eukprot:GHVU01222176.1.p1 GENE.GHVU01222176.1~~GHVU01222176.1.p1  ORF type:complete len:214 (-),score=25.81 GHVU01222176.1:1008-1649(-)
MSGRQTSVSIDRDSSLVPKTFHFKLVLLGDASVGKSCVVLRFAKDEFYEFQEPTIGAAFVTQTVHLGDSVVKFEIWDTAGQERYRSLAPMYYRGAAAAIIVYDITSKESFEGAKSWVSELQAVHSPELILALAGNKSDLENLRRVDTEYARSYAEANNLLFMETSAKNGHNVKELFHAIAERVPKHKKERAGGFQVGKGAQGSESSSWCACSR